ncbi:MAG: DMT family transporter [Alphaproteobacteria bacterium]|nr:DMT family transporter [Alphaproteobacteria bacterium]
MDKPAPRATAADVEEGPPVDERADQTRRNLQGAMWIVLSAVFATATWSQVKYLGAQLPSIEIAFFRSLFGFMIILPFLIRRGAVAFKTEQPGLQLVRGINASIILSLGFYALTHLPLAQVTAIGFSRPLFLLVLAAILLGEKVRGFRWAATVIGFIGVVIVARPSADADPAVFAALGNAALLAFGVVLIKWLAKTDGTDTMIFYVTAIQSICLAIPAFLFWQTPTPLQWLVLFGIGASGTLMQSCMVHAYRISEASALAPFDYSRLILAALVGYLVFGEVLDIWTGVGALVIVGATFYIIRREAQLGRSLAGS